VKDLLSPLGFGSTRVAVSAIVVGCRPHIGRFSVAAVTNPDEERAKAAIQGFFGGSQPEDVLLLYFVGYLLVVRNDRLWFALATTDPSAVEQTSISAELVLAEIKAAAARNIVVVLDAQIGVHQDSLPLGPWEHDLQVEDKCQATRSSDAENAGEIVCRPGQDGGKIGNREPPKLTASFGTIQLRPAWVSGFAGKARHGLRDMQSQ
jgi:hypothetical protein